MQKQIKSRRSFLKNTLGAVVAFTILPRHVLGRGFIAPSDQLTKAVIGVGGMGRGILLMQVPVSGLFVMLIEHTSKKQRIWWAMALKPLPITAK